MGNAKVAKRLRGHGNRQRLRPAWLHVFVFQAGEGERWGVDGGSAREENGRRDGDWVVWGGTRDEKEGGGRGGGVGWGGVEGLTKGMNGVSGEEGFDRKEVALRD